MKKTLIPWEVFREAVARQESWLAKSWIAFTNDGIVLLARENEPEDPVRKELAET